MLKKLELKIVPIGVVLVFAAMMKLVSSGFSQWHFNLINNDVLALGFIVIGFLITLVGVITFRQAKTPLDPRYPNKAAFLVCHGIYRYSRNPMYLGFLFMLAAWATLLSHWLALLGLPAFIGYMNQFQIKPEEKFMQEKFGEAYTKYKANVRRWL